MALVSSIASRLVLHFVRLSASLAPARGDMHGDMHGDQDMTGTVRTQSFLQGLHVSALGAALASDFIVCTIMPQPLARATARSVPVAPELPFSTYHTCQALGLGHVSIVWRVLRRGRVRPFIATPNALYCHSIGNFSGPVHGRIRVRGRGHGDSVTLGPARWWRHWRGSRSSSVGLPEVGRGKLQLLFEHVVRCERDGQRGYGVGGREDGDRGCELSTIGTYRRGPTRKN